MTHLSSISCLFIAPLALLSPYAQGSELQAPLGFLAAKTSSTKDFQAALLPPGKVFITAGRIIEKNPAPNRKSELSMSWSAVAGAKSYVVQICESPQCEIGRPAKVESSVNQEEYFHDLTTVTEPNFLATGLLPGKKYLLRVAGIDAQGHRGISSVILEKRAL